MSVELDKIVVRNRAEVLAAMDTLMHHLNEEDAICEWLAYGVPDDMNHDAFPKDVEAKRKEYVDFASDLSDSDFESMVMVFARMVKLQCFETTYQKGAFY